MGEVATRIDEARGRIAAASLRVHRPDDAKLVAVTKTVDVGRIYEAYEAGQRIFGENRVQEAIEKIALLADTMPEGLWHFIGTLQRNKARAAVQSFSLVESVNSLKLAKRLDDLSIDVGRTVPVLLEINVADEQSKSGFSVDEFWAVLPRILEFQRLEVLGLMTVAPLGSSPEDARPVFRRLRDIHDEVRDRLSPPHFRELSMGMTGDFEVAIEEGATMVRLGRAIFGERPA
jgi:pyridoxal phosphate enzyme (YggS family)